MKETIKVLVQCMYCDESFDLNAEVCNNKECEFSDRYHYDACIDEDYINFEDHMERCQRIVNIGNTLN